MRKPFIVETKSVFPKCSTSCQVSYMWMYIFSSINTIWTLEFWPSG